MRIVCMGDSITEGFGLGDDITLTYPYQLQHILNDGSEVLNFGVTCSCVTEAEYQGEPMGLPYIRQSRYQQALDAQGDKYIIMLGTNDANDGYDPETKKRDPRADMLSKNHLFSSSYRHIIRDVQNAAPNAQIFLVSPIPINNCIWPKHQERYLLKIIPQIKKLAKEFDLVFIDLHKEFEAIPDEHFLRLYQEDGLHPNSTGAMIIASILANFVQSR